MYHKEDVVVIDEMNVELDLIIKNLTFEFNQPIEVSGLVSEYKVELDFKMENGDQVKYEYTENIVGNNTIELLHINREKFELSGDFDISHGIRKVYIEHLKKLIKKDS